MDKIENDLDQLRRAALLRRLQQRGINRRSDVPSRTTIPLADRTRPLALSFAQARLWFLDQLDHAASTAYHLPFALRLHGQLDPRALQAALGRLIARHESLRTTFALHGGEPVQVIAPADTGLRLDHLDISGLPERERAWAVAQLREAEAAEPFDLATGPLIRGKLLRLAEAEHVLLVTQHHIISDGWSIGILVKEFGALYAAFSTGLTDPLLPLPLQYADYAAWQRERLQGEALRGHLRFWKTQLAGAPALLKLPTDRPRPTSQSYAGSQATFILPTALAAGIRELGRQHGTTLFMTLLAGWAVLLARISGQQDVVVGTVTANRQRRDIEPLVGFLTSTLALRVKLDSEPSVGELLAQVKSVTLDAHEHQDLPFEQVVEALQPARSAGYSPIFQVSLNLDNTPAASLSLPGLAITQDKHQVCTSHFDLHLDLHDTGADITASLTYASDLFDSETILRFADHYRTLLAGMVENPKAHVGQLPLLSPQQRRHLLVDFNRSDAEFPRELMVQQLFEAQAEASPHALAAVFADQCFSYRQLNQRANQLAHRLLALGVRPDDRVAICLSRGLDLVAAVLATLKAGAAFVPLDPAYPPERLAYMIEDSMPVALITQQAPTFALPSGNIRVLTLEAARLDGLPDTNPDPLALGLTPTNLAYVIYTSGSTGAPKGVMIEHRGLTNLAVGQIAAFRIKADSRVLQFASLSFDACVSEISTTLCRGAALYLAPREDLLPGEPLRRTLAEHGITHVTLPPVVLAAMRPSDGRSLTTLVVAGEACPLAVAEGWSEGRHFLNAYGPTEATVCATIYTHAPGPRTTLPIGQPFFNTQIYILDEWLQPSPVGVLGEIYIGGVGLARGYLNRPDLTAERFIGHPFDDRTGARLYRTGDVGRWLEGGTIEYSGRNDTQIKLRGFRIEVGEIEGRLQQHPQVMDAVVVARDERSGEKRLVAYVTTGEKVELWPSVSEFYVYDELLYHSMASHASRNQCYARAFATHLPGKVVVEIGPGPHAVLARMAIEAGAQKVYAIELLESSFLAAKAKIQQMGLEDRIILIHGDATRVDLPEPADFCISEIIGNIGGSEGAAVIINNARRFLRDPACMIPQRSLTKIAAVSLTEDMFEYAFDEIPAHYVKQIFHAVGAQFDLRLCIKGLPLSAVLSISAPFEDLDFTSAIEVEHEHQIVLSFEKSGLFTGFVIWMELVVDQDNVVETLADQGSWLPVYLPVFSEGLQVDAGSQLHVTISRRLIANALNTDFELEGFIRRSCGSDLPLRATLLHQESQFRARPFYQRLFRDGSVPIRSPRLTPQVLREHLEASLPEYMLPAAFVILPSFPLTPNNKLDRGALPAPDLEALLTRAYAAPEGAAEQAVARAWQELLGLEKVGRHDHFFELGGHSLMAARLQSRLRRTHQVDVSLRAIFEHPTLQELARIVTRTAHGAESLVTAADRSRPLPLSFAQQRLWFLDRLDRAASAAYHMPAALKLTGVLNRPALRAALDRILERHEVLRTTFAIVNGEPTQAIAPGGAFRLLEHDLRSVPERQQASTVAQLSEAEVTDRFDLEAGPLIRGRLLTLADDSHVLLMTQHHIVSDGWSFSVLVSELSALYLAFSTGQTDPLPALAIQYADYAAWQRQWLTGEVLERQTAFWKEQLAGVPTLLELPTDRPRPPVRSYAGGDVRVSLTAELSAQLRRFSQQHGVTSFMTLFAGWSILLARLSHQDDLVIGTPVANRGRAEFEPLIGPLGNILALPLHVEEGMTVVRLLGQVKATTLAAYDHQDLPFEQLVDAVQPPRSLDHSPIFQAAISLDNTPFAAPLALPELVLSQLAQVHATAQFDLFLKLVDNGEAITGVIEYASDLFNHDTVVRYAGNLRTVLGAMVADAGQAVHALPLLTATELEALLAPQAPGTNDAPDLLLHQGFEAMVAVQPDAVALVYGTRQISYAELNRRANRIAYRLLALGVRPDDRVALCLARGLDMVVGLLAILKAGGAYVPLDPDFPTERLAYMLRDSEPLAVLADRSTLPLLAAVDVPMMDLDQTDEPQDDPGNPHVPGLSPAHLAYVLYTSGSTGQPKGVMVEHRQVVNFLHGMQALLQIKSSDRMLALTTLGFDIAGLELHLPLMCGGCSVVASAAERRDGARLAETLRVQEISVMQATPSGWRLLLESGWNGALGLRAICGGEALPRELALRLAERVGALWNVYGPTETTIWSSVKTVQSKVLPSALVDIGRPIANTRYYVLDKRGQPVPMGVPGELYIGGAGVARGYLNRADLTAERFVEDPFSREPGARMYRTGDLCRRLPDGNMSYLGRNDDQVKIRGFRIEPGEIEAKLIAHAAIRNAAVSAREDEPGQKRLVAYFTVEPGAEAPAAESLHEHLRAQLPDYMLPAAFVRLKALPLTPNGKLDRKALPAPQGDVLIAHEYAAPVTDAERAIAEIWQSLLGAERVGRHDHFFELGGHSMLAVSLIERMRHHGLSTDVRTLFDRPTLAALAAAVSRGREVEEPTNWIPANCERITPSLLPLVNLSQAEIDHIIAGVPGGATNVQDIYPLSSLQEGILFHHLLESTGDAYLMRSLMIFDERKRLDGFLDAVQRVIDRHDVLRSSLSWTDLPQAVQIVHRSATLPVETLELDPQDDALEQLRRRTDTRQLRLDLRKAPLLGAYIAQDPRSPRWLLSLVTHHLVSDNVTLRLILGEIQALLEGRGDSLPVPFFYRNFIAKTRAISSAEQEAYFRSVLADVDETTAPYGVLDVRGSGATVKRGVRMLGADLGQRIYHNARRQRVPTSVLFHVAWALVVAQTSGRGNVVFGTVLSGRSQGMVGADRALGMFINTLPVLIALENRSATQVVADTHQQLGKLLINEQASLALAQRCSAVDPSMPLFTVMLNCRLSDIVDPSASGEDQHVSLEGIEILTAETRTNFPLEIAVSDAGQGFSLIAQSIDGIDPQRVAAYLATAVEGLVDALESNAEKPIQTIEVLPDAERHQLLADFNATTTVFPEDELFHRLFEVQANAQPDTVALIYGTQSLTYAQLNRRANRVARRLLELGLRPDDRVALYAERSLDMVVALFGVLKAGGAYVPLDPAQPDERIAFLLRDSAPVALLTQAALQASLPKTDFPILLLDEAEEPGPDFDTNPQVPVLTDRHLAYIIYTSGSTGQAKGVMVEHRSVVNFWRVLGLTTHRHCPAQARVALNAGFFFDMSIKGLSQLLSGHTLVIIPQAIRASASELLAFLGRHRIDAFDSTPSQLDGLLAAGLLDNPDYKPVSVLLGGEPITTVTWEKLRHSPVTRFYNMYGPTECTVDATIGLIRDLGEQPSIGRPIANAQVHVLDADRRLVPIGVVGEIYIGGLGVARGYLNRPALTAERFVPDPFVTRADARLYKTGDLGRYLPDGTLEYFGRNDFQIKLRGFRIELGEIEAALAVCEGIRNAVVIAREDVPGDSRLVAYMVARDGAVPAAATLRAELAKILPEYMIPSAFVLIEALPLTRNGKLDRAALPAPDQAALATSPYEAPQGPTEVAIAELWQRLLGVERIGRHDRFFDVGGHSLLAVQVLSRLRRMLGVRIVLRDFFAQPTVAGLAAIATQTTETALPPIPVADRSKPLPLSFAQQRLWFLDQFDQAAGAAYHLPNALRLCGNLNHGALRATLNRILARHENLRTSFAAIDGAPMQVIAPANVGFALIEQDLRGKDKQSQAARVAEAGDDEARTPFDLSSGPVVRGQLLRLADQEHVLLVTLHHIVSDAWSTGLLLRELSTLYGAFDQGRPDPLPPLPLQYADYAAWQRQWLQSEALREQIGFWKAHLADAPALIQIPTDRERPAEQSYVGGMVNVVLPPELSASLRQWSKRQDVTLFMTLLAAWAILLSYLSKQDDIVVGTPVANRQRPEVETIIGFFVNTLALRVLLKDKPTVAQLVHQVKTTTLAAYNHQDIPFEHVVEVLQPVRNMAHSPLFQVMLSLNNTPAGQLDLPGLTLAAVEQTYATTKFDLSLSLVEADGDIAGSLQYASDLFDAATIESIAEKFQEVIAAMVADAQLQVATLIDALPTFDCATRMHQTCAEVSAERPYEAPRGQLEIAIAELWQELLGRERIGRYDDFFELGGISLMAVRVVSRLRQSLGLPVAIRDLFNHPNVAGFAAVLSSSKTASPAPHPSLVPIRPEGSQRPIFLVHPLGGEVQYARDLLPWLDPDLPVYGIAAYGFGGNETPLETMDDIVELYIRAMKHVQPRGPYRMAGWSAGGLIAYEIARRMLIEDEVEFVGVIDTFARPGAMGHDSTVAVAEELPSETDFLLGWLPDNPPQETLDRLHSLAAMADVEAMLALCQSTHLLPGDIPRDIEPGLLRRHLSVAYTVGKVISRYITAPLPMTVFVFAARDEPRADKTLGWAPLLGERLRLIPLKGTHLSLVRPPHAQALGAAISNALAAEPRAVLAAG